MQHAFACITAQCTCTTCGNNTSYHIWIYIICLSAQWRKHWYWTIRWEKFFCSYIFMAFSKWNESIQSFVSMCGATSLKVAGQCEFSWKHNVHWYGIWRGPLEKIRERGHNNKCMNTEHMLEAASIGCWIGGGGGGGVSKTLMRYDFYATI